MFTEGEGGRGYDINHADSFIKKTKQNMLRCFSGAGKKLDREPGTQSCAVFPREQPLNSSGPSEAGHLCAKQTGRTPAPSQRGRGSGEGQGERAREASAPGTAKFRLWVGWMAGKKHPTGGLRPTTRIRKKVRREVQDLSNVTPWARTHLREGGIAGGWGAIRGWALNLGTLRNPVTM